jgi:hypothetical protein
MYEVNFLKRLYDVFFKSINLEVSMFILSNYSKGGFTFITKHLKEYKALLKKKKIGIC